MNPKTIILFGPAGSGKGTQAEQITKHFSNITPHHKVVYVETGARLREFIKGEGYTKQLVHDVLTKGGLLPEFMPIWIWTSAFINELNVNDHIVLDGLCRRPPEAPVLDGAMQFYGRKNPFIIVLNVSDEECRRRSLARNRSDDAVEKINNRLSWYKKDVVPSVEYFRNNSYYKVIDINGEQTIEKVHADIVAAIS